MNPKPACCYLRAALSGLCLLACIRIQAAELPNIVWINAEDMSPHLGCYGHPDAHTPQIDALARQGIVYRNAFATAPICSPSRSCLATGLYATSLGTQHLRCEVRIPERIVPLAVRLRQLGYFCTNTGKSDYNFSADGIWDEWSADPMPWRKRRSGQPFFSFITIGETHEGRINFRDRYEEATAELPESLRHDSQRVTIPPFYPDTAEIRSIFAGMYDLATVFDSKVGVIVEALREQGDLDNTIIFVFGDHGNGLPRYKRWLNDSGLRVPLVVFIPPKFRGMSDLTADPAAAADSTGKPQYTTSDRLVSFVDFPATALRLAGAESAAELQGIPFLGKDTEAERKFVFGARSRADDMFEVSRSVCDGRFMYVKHFLPHFAYIQDSVIFDDRKDSFRELRRLHVAGQLDMHAERMWSARKPPEELYDLQADPHELVNLAESAEHEAVRKHLGLQLRQWIIEHRDSGFLTEAEYQIRAAEQGTTPYDVMQDPALNLAEIVELAWRVGDGDSSAADLINGLRHKEAAVRYWAATACAANLQFAEDQHLRNTLYRLLSPALQRALSDGSPSVRIAAAEAVLRVSSPALEHQRATAVLGEVLQDLRPWVSLEAASALARLGDSGRPLVATMKEVVNRNRSVPGSPRPYKDFNYASFTGWALETALTRCGEMAFVNEINGGH